MVSKKLIALSVLTGAIFLLAACNYPGTSVEPTAGPDLAGTAAAQTLTAIETQVGEGTPVVFPSPTTGQATATSPVVILPTNTAVPPTNTVVPSATPLPTNTPIPPTPTNTPIPCDRAHFVKDVTIPDNTEIAAGSTFVKTWRIENNGSCTWTSAYSLVFYNGDQMSGPNSAQLTNGTVPPGGEIDISVTLIAPASTGTYKGNWRLRNASGNIFGIGPNADQSFYVQIKSVTPTPTPSPTPAYTMSFDFIAQGPNATWRNATNTIPWGDPDDDNPGVAVNVANVKMEDGQTYPSLLAEYPQHINNGMLAGLYPAYTVKANDHLRTTIGFKYNCGTSKIRFQIHYIEGSSDVLVVDELQTCDGKLLPIDVNLGELVGHTVQFELVVIADGTPDSWASLWIAPRIER